MNIESEQIQLINTIFLSIVLEALPFILLGVIVSSIMQSFISDETFRKWLPKKTSTALIPASLLGFIFPICDCAIIPIVSGLIKKGLKLHLGVIILITAPVINPIVMMSTYFAFNLTPKIFILRFVLIFILALLTSFLVYLIFKKTNQVRTNSSDVAPQSVALEIKPKKRTKQDKWKQALFHMNDEFLSTGKFIVFGAFLAALIQTYLNREVFASISSNEWIAGPVAMAFAFVIQVCSSSDAFIAASFNTIFTGSALLAFLTFGPILDMKNLFLMLSYFKFKFVVVFSLIVITIIYIFSLVLHFFIL